MAQQPSSGQGGPGGPPSGPPPSQGPNKRLQQTQAQVDEVVGIMKVNVEKVLERDEKLQTLDMRADALQLGASQFEQSAGKLKRKFWWKNLKMWLILAAVVIVLIIIIVVWVVSKNKPDATAAPVTASPAADVLVPSATPASGSHVVGR